MTQTNHRKGRGIQFLQNLIGFQGGDCVIWPLYRREDGYGLFGHEGGHYRAHRYMCELENGPPPTPEHEAAHSCGNGHGGCVNPNHLSWKTRSGNQQDRVRMGRIYKGKRYKLTVESVAEIKRLAGTVTNTEMATRYGVSRATIYQIIRGQTWPNGERSNNGYRRDDPRNVGYKNRASRVHIHYHGGEK